MIDGLEATFKQLTQDLFAQTQADEVMTVTLMAEQSQFTRFNRAKVRQTGCVTDGSLTLTLMANQRVSSASLSYTGHLDRDRPQVMQALTLLRDELLQLPDDPFLVVPSGAATSRDIYTGSLLAPDQVVEAILPAVAGLDFAGLYAGGWVVRAYADSVGQHHWFATETFSLDYSLFTGDRQAVKGSVAGSQWNPATYATDIARSQQQLAKLQATPPRAIPRGQYRTYLAPAALGDLTSMFSWGAVSESMLQRGGSALAAMRRDGKTLSPQFTLLENFQYGSVPRFNDLGELAPLELAIIDAGELKNALVSSRTAKEFGLMANGSPAGEYLRAPEVKPGTLAEADILATLDTGLYLSNLHYLNWSDRPNGRITGMTRYACFWVENGEIVAPIENLRFDESLYRCFGECLVDLTQQQTVIPEIGTYSHRSLGGMRVPGAIVADFTYTL